MFMSAVHGSCPLLAASPLRPLWPKLLMLLHSRGAADTMSVEQELILLANSGPPAITYK
jgi:hypothetical protein